MRLEKFGYIVKSFLDSGRGIVLLFAFEKAEISPGELSIAGSPVTAEMSRTVALSDSLVVATVSSGVAPYGSPV